jgi:hypothetical protein
MTAGRFVPMNSPRVFDLLQRPARELSVVSLLRWACVAVFAARAWQHLRFDAPFRALLWDERVMTPVVEALLGMDWVTYSRVSDAYIQGIIQGFGVFYGLCAVAAWRCRADRFWNSVIVGVGACALLFLSYLYYRDTNGRIYELIEYAIQWMAPLALLFAVHLPARPAVSAWVMKLAIVGTFLGHGHYAMSVYGYPPVAFVNMTMRILGLGEENALRFLWWAGFLDLLVCVAIFLPRRIALAGLAYAAVWGALTALARPVAYVAAAPDLNERLYWLNEGLLRTANALIPAALFLLLYAASGRPALSRAAVTGAGDVSLTSPEATPTATPRIIPTP